MLRFTRLPNDALVKVCAHEAQRGGLVVRATTWRCVGANKPARLWCVCRERDVLLGQHSHRTLVAAFTRAASNSHVDDRIQLGLSQLVHLQHTAALATFRECPGSCCVAVGYQAVAQWMLLPPDGLPVPVEDERAARQAMEKALAGGLRAEATKGNHYAQFVLGYFLLHPRSDHNGNEAAVLLENVASQGNAMAQLFLGRCYYYGGSSYGVGKNRARAVALFTEAAGQGCALAQWWLGRCYRDDEGVGKDVERAGHFFSLAAAQGDEQSKGELAAIHNNNNNKGDGVTSAAKAGHT